VSTDLSKVDGADVVRGRPVRTLDTAPGRLVPLPEQDRSRWDRALIAEGQDLVGAAASPVPSSCRPRSPPSTPTQRRTPTPTGRRCWRCPTICWPSTPPPLVALNRAVGLAELAGPAAALTVVDRLELPGYAPFYAVRADLLRRTGQHIVARLASTRPSPVPGTTRNGPSSLNGARLEN